MKVHVCGIRHSQKGADGTLREGIIIGYGLQSDDNPTEYFQQGHLGVWYNPEEPSKSAVRLSDIIRQTARGVEIATLAECLKVENRCLIPNSQEFLERTAARARVLGILVTVE